MYKRLAMIHGDYRMNNDVLVNIGNYSTHLEVQSTTLAELCWGSRMT